MRQYKSGQVASRTRWGLVVCFVVGIVPPANAQRVIYVSENASGTSDGNSWIDAYPDLQDALDDVRDNGGCPCEIWIAAGTYKPDRGTGDRTMAFELFGTVSLLGGFAGWEDCPDDRDADANETILSGDLGGDDEWLVTPPSDCCEPGGFSPSCSNPECQATVTAVDPSCDDERGWRFGCSVRALSLCCELCRPTRCDNTFNVVRAFEFGSAPLLDGLTIRDGAGHDPDEMFPPGSGLSTRDADVRITASRLLRNGAGAFYASHGTPVVKDALFMENGTLHFSYPALTIWGSDNPAPLRGLRFIDNLGGGADLSSADYALTDCTFRDNGEALHCADDCTVVGCEFVGNRNGGIFAGGQPTIIDSLFLGNFGNAVYTFSGALVINSVFAGNTGYPAGGLEAGSAYILNSVFFANGDDALSTGDGGATIRNSIFWRNYDEAGDIYEGAQFYSLGPISVSHTIVDGWTGYWGGVGNSGVDPLFADADGADDIPGTEDDDLRLLPGSPAINAGDPDETYLPPIDLDGHARVLCGRVDIGAYELGIGDYDCNQTVDLTDFAQWPACMTGPNKTALAGEPPVAPDGCEAFDFNADGAIDLADFQTFQVAF